MGWNVCLPLCFFVGFSVLPRMGKHFWLIDLECRPSKSGRLLAIIVFFPHVWIMAFGYVQTGIIV